MHLLRLPQRLNILPRTRTPFDSFDCHNGMALCNTRWFILSQKSLIHCLVMLRPSSSLFIILSFHCLTCGRKCRCICLVRLLRGLKSRCVSSSDRFHAVRLLFLLLFFILCVLLTVCLYFYAISFSVSDYSAPSFFSSYQTIPI